MKKHLNLKNFLIVMSGCWLCPVQSAHGFVLLSGPSEAKLSCTATSPQVTFIMSDAVPPIEGKADFLDGKYADLSDAEFFRAVILEAMAPWNDASESFVELILSDEVGDNNSTSGDGINHIVVKDVNLSSAAFAKPMIEGSGINDCDITIGKNKTSSTYLAYTVLHELGHCLGLGHNHTDYDAVMGYSRSDHDLRLGLDDLKGVTYLYPNADVGSDQETLGCGVIGGNNQPQSHARNWGLIFVLLMPVFITGTLSLKRLFAA